jgi:hypothetical protein
MTKRTRMSLLFGAILTIGGASVWFTVSVLAQGSTTLLASDVGDLSNSTTVEVKDASGAVVLRGNFVEAPEDDDDVERKATLTGSGSHANAKGEAEIEVSRTDAGLDQEVELSVSSLAPGASYTMVVDAKALTTFQTDKEGKAEIELATPPGAKR